MALEIDRGDSTNRVCRDEGWLHHPGHDCSPMLPTVVLVDLLPLTHLPLRAGATRPVAAASPASKVVEPLVEFRSCGGAALRVELVIEDMSDVETLHPCRLPGYLGHEELQAVDL